MVKNGHVFFKEIIDHVFKYICDSRMQIVNIHTELQS